MYTYAGIGSRKTPYQTLTLMTKCARRLNELGFILRSGGASGADTAFELGVPDNKKEIFLPWRRFNDNPSHLYTPDPLAMEMARKFHPAWDKCSNAARKFHARNCHQVLGRDLNVPADFILCWTPEGKPVGGTGQALRLAAHWDIPVINMCHTTWRDQIAQVVSDVRDEYAAMYEQQAESDMERRLTEQYNECGTRMY